jgi:tRNA dimethylallyltransferase
MNKPAAPSLAPVALIAGPTASGKSALALRLAEIANGTIVNADSAQVYRDLRVLSARPSIADEARAPHRLFGYIDGAESCSAARWAADARAAITQAHAAERLPILVGGTGLYLRTLIDGIAPVPEIDPAVRAEVRALAVGDAHAALAIEDARAAARLRPSDTTRVARALEIVRSTGRTIAEWQQDRIGGIANTIRLVPLVLLPPREWLRDRCDARFLEMLGPNPVIPAKAGIPLLGFTPARQRDSRVRGNDGQEMTTAIDEVETLLARRLDPALPVMRAIGVREIAAMLAGEIDRPTAIAQAQAATRQYAKRQYTWFNNQPPADWPHERSQLDDIITDRIVIKLRDIALTR